MRGPPWKRSVERLFCIALVLVLLAAGASAALDRFDEHLTLRPLADGRLHTLFSFVLQSGQDEVGDSKDSATIPIYSTVPRSLIHLARASNAQEIHLAINSGRWDYQRWGEAGAEEMVGTGAEVWAKLRHDADGDDDDDDGARGLFKRAANESINPSIMANWRKLTANLAGLFCASLDALDERLTIEPFHRRGEKSKTSTLHALLASESICTENLSTLLKLLPCKTMTGLASLLKPHRFFSADFHGMVLHVEEQHGGAWKVTMNIQAVFAPVMRPLRQGRNWSLLSIFGTKLQQSCPLVQDSYITVIAPHQAFPRIDIGEEEVPEFTVWPVVVNAEESRQDLEAEEAMSLDQKAERFARRIRKDGHYTFDTRSSTNLNVEMKWTKESEFQFPSRFNSPSLLASRIFSGSGQEHGLIELTISNSEAIRERRVTYFEVLPWFIKPYLHTLDIQVQADDYDENEDNLVRFQDDLTAPLLLSLNYSPSPFHMEAQLRIPPQSTIRLTMEFDKSFLKYAEHPPDAHRGFDVAPATVLLEDGGKIYTNPALIEVAVPDFSMPYNVIIFTSTLIALCAGSTLNNLLRKYTDIVTEP